MAVVGDLSVWQAETFGEELVDLTVGGLLEEQARAFAEHPFLVCSDVSAGVEVRQTYGELLVQVDTIARGLLALDLVPGRKVAVLAPNIPAWIWLEFAIARIGAVLVTVNTNSRRAELDYLLSQAEVDTVCLIREHRGNSYLEALLSLVPELANRTHPLERVRSARYPHLRHVVFLESPPAGFAGLSDLERAGLDVPHGQVAARTAATQAHDVFQIQFTSGTTGNPKGAMITHHGAVNNGRLFARRAGLRASDRLLSAMPLFHTAGNVMELMGVVTHGACLVKAITFEAAAMLRLLDAEKATVLSAVPTMVIAILQQHAVEGSPDGRHLRLVISGGTPIPVPVMEKVRDTFGAQPMIGFGMTEASPMVTGTLPDDSFELKSATVGIPLPRTEVQVVDSDGRPTPLGIPGELLIRGYLVMRGYYRMPDKTAQTIDTEGWLHSGDLATLDAKGYLRIVGRIKDMVIRGGENVYPAEVETFLMRHPAIHQAQVVGVPDPYMGEETAAFIQLREGALLTEEQLREHCRREIARHKVPKYFRFVSSFPLTPSGKVKKFELREQFMAETGDPVLQGG